jgi:hypothetical protein
VGSIVAGVVGLILASLSTFGVITVTNNASKPVPGQADANIVIYGTTN